MKTPLAVISNNAQLLANRSVDEERRAECTENILVASRRLNSLITNMLKLNKLEKQTIQPVPASYDVCEQLAECVFQYEELLESRQLELEPDLEDRCFVLADAELMELVWTNLISNAIKFTPPGGTITLTQKAVGDFAEISVADTGCGMSAETQKHIFEKFYQGTHPTQLPETVLDWRWSSAFWSFRAVQSPFRVAQITVRNLRFSSAFQGVYHT